MADPVAKYVALLRGINLGKNRRVSMSDLRNVFMGLGFTDVQTILQSGNVVFGSKPTTTKHLEELLEVELTETLAMPIQLLVLSTTNLEKIVSQNPFSDHTHEGSKLSVTLLRCTSTAAECKAVESVDVSPDEVVAVGRALYFWCPNGMGRSPAMAFNWDKVIAPSLASNRNWNTIVKLRAAMS